MTLTALLSLLISTTALAAKPDLPDLPNLACRDVAPLAMLIASRHYSKPDLDEVSPAAARRYVEYLDPSRSLLLAHEAKDLERLVGTALADSQANDCSALEQGGRLIIERARGDAERVAGQLVDSFTIDDSIEIIIDSEAAGWAKTEAERQVRITALVHYQVAALVDAGVDPAEARSKVKHRYEVSATRQARRRGDAELPGVYIDALAGSIDPHSTYFSAEEMADFQISMQLSLEGIGAALRNPEGLTTVESLVPGGPAERDGRLQPGDIITAVSQEGQPPVDIIDEDLRDVVQLIRGAKGTDVTLTLLRKGKQTRTFDITLTRDRIDLEEQAASLNIREVQRDGKTLRIAVLDMPSFYGGEDGGRTLSGDVAGLLAKARAQQADGVIIDLSRNGGGLLSEAVRVAGFFIRQGSVVATQTWDGAVDVLDDTDPGLSWSGPLVVLTSPVSASGSEILAGALRDYKRAVIVGEGPNTFGKGTVQQVYPLPGDVGALKVTTGMFFLPSGHSTQREGVPSDIVVPSPLQAIEIGEGILDNALPPGEITPFLSGKANDRSPERKWTAIEPGRITALQAASAARVKDDAVLQAVLTELGEKEEDQVRISVGELRQDGSDKDTAPPESDPDPGGTSPEDAAHDRAGGDDAEDDPQHEAFVNEGIAIMADLIGLLQQE